MAYRINATVPILPDFKQVTQLLESFQGNNPWGKKAVFIYTLNQKVSIFMNSFNVYYWVWNFVQVGTCISIENYIGLGTGRNEKYQ